MIRKCLLVLLSLGLGNWLQAQDQRWTLRECLEYALETNIQLKQAKLNLRTNEINLRQSQERRLPNLNSSNSYNVNFGRSINPFTNTFSTEQITSLNLGISSNVTLFNGMQVENSIKRDKLALEAGRMDVKDAENILALDITAAYLNIILNKEIVESAEFQLQSIIEQRERTRKLVDAGSLARNSIVELDGQIATEELNLVNANNQLALAYLRLQQILNLTPNEGFEIVVPELDDPDGNIGLATANEVYETAIKTQPNIQSAKLQILSAEKDLAVSKGTWMPSLSFGGSLGTGYASGRERIAGFDTVSAPLGLGVTEFRNTPDGSVSDQAFVSFTTLNQVREEISLGDQLSDNVSYGFGFQLTIPLYNRGQSRAAIQRSMIQLENARYNADLQAQQLRQTIEQAYLDAVSAYSTFQQGEKQLSQLQLAFENTEKRFEVGLDNSVDYVVSKNNLARATNDLIRAKYDYIFKVKILDFYQGNLIGF